MTRFSPEVLQRLEATEEIDLESRRRHTRARRATIWAVVSDGKAYVRSIRGTAGPWYRELRAAREGILRLGRRAIPVRAVAVRSPKALREVSAAYRRKYRSSPYLSTVLTPRAVTATLRLEPR